MRMPVRSSHIPPGTLSFFFGVICHGIHWLIKPRPSALLACPAKRLYAAPERDASAQVQGRPLLGPSPDFAQLRFPSTAELPPYQE